MRLRSAILALALVAPASMKTQSSSDATPSPKRHSLPTRWIVAYPGSLKGGMGVTYTTDDWVHLLSAVDTLGRPTKWLSTGAILINIYAPSGRSFATWIAGTPADGSDWEHWIDSLTVAGGILARLDSAVGVVTHAVGPLGRKFPVAVMLPYPDPQMDSIQFDSAVYHLRTTQGRVAVDSDFIHRAHARIDAGGFSALRLDGFYWLGESVQAFDTATVQAVAPHVHAEGLRFLWVPYFFGPGQQYWRRLGFDEAWLQPNYFFHPELSTARLDSAVVHATAYDLGLEVELNQKIYKDSTYYGRVDPYLAAIRAHPKFKARSMAIFDGQGALIKLSESSNPRDRAVYRRLVDLLTEK